MKRKLRNVCLLLGAGFLMLVVTNAQAQTGPRVGFKGGLNMSNLYSNYVDDDNARFGWHLGVYTDLFQSEVFTIRPEISYSTKGTGVTYVSTTNGVSVDHDQRFNLNYLDIPVLAVFKLGEAAEIEVGPYWSYLLGASIRNNEGDANNEFDPVDRRNFDNWDYGLAGGIGFNLGKAAQLGARYNYGLNPIAASSGAKRVFGNAKNQVAQIYLSFNLNADDMDRY